MVSPTILVVDDEAEQLKRIVDIVHQYLPGWEVLQASSLKEAREQLKPQLCAAVVDRNLSRPALQSEGLGLLREVREQAPACFNILVSSKLNLHDDLPPDLPYNEVV